MKFATFANAPPGHNYRSFQDWFAKEHGPAIAKRVPTLVGGVIRRRIEPPNPSLVAGSSTDPVNGIAPYDVLLETWLPSLEDFRREMLPVEQRLREIGSRYISYAVAPRLQKDPRYAEAGPSGKRPEVTMIISLKWNTALTAEAGSQAWADHAPVALRAQKAITKYEQNIVTKTISWTPGTPAIHGFGDFSFRTVSDLVNGYRVTEEELQDTANLASAFHGAILGDAIPL